MSCSCGCSPCHCDDPPDPNNEPLSSALNNFITAFFGTLTKTVVDDKVVWILPCDLETGTAEFPRLPNEGIACYLLRIFGTLSLSECVPVLDHTTADFIQPAVAAQVNITVADGSKFPVGEQFYVMDAGEYLVDAASGNTLTVTRTADFQYVSTGGTVPANSIVELIQACFGFTESATNVSNLTFTSPDLIQTKETRCFVNGRLIRITSLGDSIVFTGVNC